MWENDIEQHKHIYIYIYTKTHTHTQRKLHTYSRLTCTRTYTYAHMHAHNILNNSKYRMISCVLWNVKLTSFLQLYVPINGVNNMTPLKNWSNKTLLRVISSITRAIIISLIASTKVLVYPMVIVPSTRMLSILLSGNHPRRVPLSYPMMQPLLIHKSLKMIRKDSILPIKNW